MAYQPMSLSDLAARLAVQADEKIRWKLVWEFLEEYRWEPAEARLRLLEAEPVAVGDERWDVLLAAFAEHLAAQQDMAPAGWTQARVLETPWFPSDLPSKRVEALVWAPAAFRKHGVFLSRQDLEAA